MKANPSYYQSCLKETLADRTAKNPRYSLRAFAKNLGVNPGALSQILQGKQVPSLKTAKRILQALHLDPNEQERFLGSIAAIQRSRGLQRLNPAFRTIKSDHASSPVTLDLFKVIADWYHYAILELTYLEGFKSDPKWIAQTLGITKNEAEVAIERLIKLGFLEKTPTGLRKTNDYITTQDQHLTTAALRRHQLQALERAQRAIETEPIERRSAYTLTLSVNPQKIPLARQAMTEFAQGICELMNDGPQKEVYQLGIYFVPITNQKENQK